MAIRLIENNNSNILINDDYTDNLSDDIFGSLDAGKTVNVFVKEAGRGNVTFFLYAEKPMVHKHYLRGGLISKLIFDQYLWLSLDQTRAFVEFRALEEMSQLGLPVPRPIAARVNRRWGCYTAELITEKIDNTKTLGDCLYDESFSEHIFLIIGETIKNFHSKGCYHPDLNVENILIDDAQNVFLLDFDRWKSRGATKRLGTSNLERLKSSINKRQVSRGRPFPQKEWEGLLDAYHSAP